MFIQCFVLALKSLTGKKARAYYHDKRDFLVAEIPKWLPSGPIVITVNNVTWRRYEYYIFEPRHEISNNVVCATSKGSDQPARTRSLIRAFASRLNIL